MRVFTQSGSEASRCSKRPEILCVTHKVRMAEDDLKRSFFDGEAQPFTPAPTRYKHVTVVWRAATQKRVTEAMMTREL